MPAAALAVMVVITAAGAGAVLRIGCELVNREGHSAEYAAGIITVIENTFLFGNAVFGAAHDILCLALETHDREEAERKNEIAGAAIVGDKVRGQGIQHAFRDVIGSAATAAFTVAAFHDFR